MSEQGDFAFVAGVPRPIPTPRSAGPQSAVDLLVDAIAILTDWRKRSPFECVAEVRHVDQSDLFTVVARPRELSYRVTNAASGAINSYDGHSGIISEGAAERPVLPSEMSPEPMAVRLAFPLSLSIWGRPGDSYRMTGASETHDEIVITLIHQKDESITGSLVIDRERRIATRLDTPTLGISYRDIRIVTTAGPPLARG